MYCLKPSPPSILRAGLICLIFANAPSLAQNIWVNEIHYENAGTDVNEFIEIALENSGNYSLSDFTISLYNGTTLTVYNSKTLNTFTVGSTYANFTFYYYVLPTDGIQNGTDGIAIDFQGNLIQLLSYDGTFTPDTGPANAITSQDIGVKELTSTPAGLSLQLTGSGDQYAEFFWLSPASNTLGAINNGQSFTSSPALTTSAPLTGYDFGPISFGKNTQPKNYTFVGANLSSDVVITPPTGFQLSLIPNFSGSVYSDASPLIIPAVAGTIGAIRIYVRFNPLASNGLSYSGNIIHSASGAPDASITVTGSEGSPNAWINEFHYNNVSVDKNEFIEVIIKNASSYALRDFAITLYNGASGNVYDSETLDHFNVGEIFAAYSIYSLNFTGHSFFNIQNGPDGIALTYKGNLILFISYEGSFMGMDGPAANSVSENIALSESNATPENSSIYLINALSPASTYNDFTWVQSLGSNSMGMVNPLEVLPVVLTNFSAGHTNEVATLRWMTSSERNNKGFNIEKSTDKNNFVDIGFVNSKGDSEMSTSYQFEDRDFSQTTYYRLRQTGFSHRASYSKIIIVEGDPVEFIHFFPNPANQFSTISITDFDEHDMLLAHVIDQRGTDIVLKRGTLEEINRCLQEKFFSGHEAGIYFLKLFYNGKIKVIKIILH